MDFSKYFFHAQNCERIKKTVSVIHYQDKLLEIHQHYCNKLMHPFLSIAFLLFSMFLFYPLDINPLLKHTRMQEKVDLI